MKAGWCAPPGAFNEWTHSIVRWSQASSIKLFEFQIRKPGDRLYPEASSTIVDRLRAQNPGVQLIVRMHDSFWDWQNRTPSAEDWGNAQARLAHVAASMGIYLGQFDNEPNFHQRDSGFAGEWDYRQFFSEAYDVFEANKPLGFKTISPPLMHRHDSRWKHWYNVNRDQFERCDYIGVNEYWQDPLTKVDPQWGSDPNIGGVAQWTKFLVATGMYDSVMPQRYHENFGWAHAWVHRLFPAKKLIILECGSSWDHREPRPELLETYSIAARQIPLWAERAQLEAGKYIQSFHIFTLPGTGRGIDLWRGFLGTEHLAKSLGRCVVCAGLEY